MTKNHEGGVSQVTLYVKGRTKLVDKVCRHIWTELVTKYRLPCSHHSAIFTGSVTMCCLPGQVAEVREDIERIVREL